MEVRYMHALVGTAVVTFVEGGGLRRVCIKLSVKTAGRDRSRQILMLNF
jgi:hypothetical protein